MKRSTVPLSAPIRTRSGSLRRAAAAASALGLGILAGCENRQIRVEMAVTGDGTSRAFASNVLEKQDVERLQSVYAAQPEPDAATGGERFAGTFDQTLPSEVGNRNGTSEVRTRFGTTRFYFEAFAPAADEWAALKERIDAGELWVRLFGRWAEKGIKDESKREEWRRYVSATLVPLSTELAVMWGSNVSVAQALRVAAKVRDENDRTPLTDEERLLRRSAIPMLLEVVAADLLTAEEMHRLLLVSSDATASKAERDWVVATIAKPALLRLVQRFRPETTDLEKVSWVPLALSFWFWAQTSTERNDLLLASPVISESDKERLRKGEADVTLPPPFGVEPLSKPTKTDAEVLLATGERPFLTNGEWIESERRVRFRYGFVAANRRTSLSPPAFFAAWSEPDTAAQTKAFGSVLLTGEGLADYGIWYESLTPPLKARWDAAVERLEQGDRAPMQSLRRELEAERPVPRPIVAWLDGPTG